MAISGDYPHPVTVNGFSCRNCSEVAQAEHHIDPHDPQSGPFGVNGTSPAKEATKNHFSPEARHQDMLRELHELHEQNAQIAGNHVAAAYDAPVGAAPGQFIDRSA